MYDRKNRKWEVWIGFRSVTNEIDAIKIRGSKLYIISAIIYLSYKEWKGY